MQCDHAFTCTNFCNWRIFRRGRHFVSYSRFLVSTRENPLLRSQFDLMATLLLGLAVLDASRNSIVGNSQLPRKTNPPSPVRYYFHLRVMYLFICALTKSSVPIRLGVESFEQFRTRQIRFEWGGIECNFVHSIPFGSFHSVVDSVDSTINRAWRCNNLAFDFVRRLSGRSKKGLWLSEIRPTRRRVFDPKGNQKERGNEPFNNQPESKATLKEQKNCQLDLSIDLFVHFLVSISTVENLN